RQILRIGAGIFEMLINRCKCLVMRLLPRMDSNHDKVIQSHSLAAGQRTTIGSGANLQLVRPEDDKRSAANSAERGSEMNPEDFRRRKNREKCPRIPKQMILQPYGLWRKSLTTRACTRQGPNLQPL